MNTRGEWSDDGSIGSLWEGIYLLIDMYAVQYLHVGRGRDGLVGR